MTDTTGVASYARPEYWDIRYQKDPEVIEWHQMSWPALKESFAPYVKPTESILNVGCGNSLMSEEMFDEGFKTITNIDVSSVLITQMQTKYQDKPGLIYRQMDCRHMDGFPDASFNSVIDKATLDSIVCGEGSATNVQKYLSEVSRVLKPNGTFLMVSHAQPQYRQNYVNKDIYGWTIEVLSIPRPVLNVPIPGSDEKDNFYYVYVCQKGARKH